MNRSKWKVGDRIQLKDGSVAGTVTAVDWRGAIGIDWDDGDKTAPGGIHRDDVDREAKR